MAVDEVRQMGADAQAVIDALAAEHLPDSDVIQKAHNRVFDAATALTREAAGPITIGIVGEFSVGKSMLLGTLLGHPALLPVEERATTGNITALEIRPGDNNQPTVVDGAVMVHFLSEGELAECVGYMCDKLAAAARYSKIPDVAVLEGGYNPATDGWGRLEKWCRSQLWIEGIDVGSLESRKIAAELLAVRDAQLSVRNAPGFLGNQTRVAGSLVKAALDLRPAEGNPTTYPPPNPILGLDLTAVEHSEAALAKVFPLIRRVSYGVRVSQTVWSLSSLRGTDEGSIVILDFPGLATSRSAARDEFLSKNELDKVHTIITVYNAGKADSGVPDQFFSMLESAGRTPAQVRDYIIAVGNAFDRIEPPSFSDDGPLTTEGLRSASTDFRSLVAATSNLTQHREDRVRLVSSVAAIANYHYPTADFSDDQKARLTRALEGAAERQEQWGQIGKRLETGDPDSPWGATISSFGDDGGIASLRKLIESHVAEHGLVNKINGLRMKRDQLIQALRHLEALLPAEQVSGDETAANRLLVDQVSDEFRRQTAVTIASASQFRDPMQLEHANTGVIDEARSRCMAEVMAWPEWGTLLLRAKEGLITKGESASRLRRGPLGNRPGSNEGTTDSTQIFLERFNKSLEDVLSSSRNAMTAAVSDWVEERNQTLAELRSKLADPRLLDLLTEGGNRLAAAGRGDPDREGPLRVLADLQWAADLLAELIQDEVVTEEWIADSFPLPLPRYLPWNKAIPEQDGDVEQSLVRHQMYMFRMRREIASAMADAVAARLALDLAEFRRELLGNLNLGMELIPDPGTVRAMFPDPPKAGHDVPAEASATGSPVRSLLREWRARNA